MVFCSSIVKFFLVVCCWDLFINGFMCMFLLCGLFIIILVNCVDKVFVIVLIWLVGIIIWRMVVYFCLVLVVIFLIIFLMKVLNSGVLVNILVFSKDIFRLLVFILKCILEWIILVLLCSLIVVLVDFVKNIKLLDCIWFIKLWFFL